MLPYDLFISYRSLDAPCVFPLVACLRALELAGQSGVIGNHATPAGGAECVLHFFAGADIQTPPPSLSLNYTPRYKSTARTGSGIAHYDFCRYV